MLPLLTRLRMTPCWWLITVWKESQSSMGFLNPNARSGEDKEKRLRKTQSPPPLWSLLSEKHNRSMDHSGLTFLLEKMAMILPFWSVSSLSACHFCSFQAQTRSMRASFCAGWYIRYDIQESAQSCMVFSFGGFLSWLAKLVWISIHIHLWCT